MFKHELGIMVKCKITPFKGIVVSRAEHFTGCNTYGVAPTILNDGKRIDCEWFDEDRIVKVGNGINPKSVQGAKKGGPLSPRSPGK